MCIPARLESYPSPPGFQHLAFLSGDRHKQQPDQGRQKDQRRCRPWHGGVSKPLEGPTGDGSPHHLSALGSSSSLAHQCCSSSSSPVSEIARAVKRTDWVCPNQFTAVARRPLLSHAFGSRSWVSRQNSTTGQSATGSRHVARFPETSWTSSLACPMGVFEDYSRASRFRRWPKRVPMTIILCRRIARSMGSVRICCPARRGHRSWRTKAETKRAAREDSPGSPFCKEEWFKVLARQ